MKGKELLTEKIRQWDTVFDGKKTRDNFLKSEFGQYFRKKQDINKNGGWSELYSYATSKKPPKLGNKFITQEKLFREYSRIQIELGILDRSLKLSEIDSIGKISGSKFKKEFQGGLRQFYLEHRKWGDGNYENKSLRNTNGKGAEYLAVAELIFRGFNAQLISIDEGLDIIAYKDGELYFFQVKHTAYGREVKITRSSFENNINSAVYYMFILSDEIKKNFLIIPVSVMEKFVNQNGKKVTCKFLLHEKEVYINKVLPQNKVTKYLNNGGWKILQYSR